MIPTIPGYHGDDPTDARLAVFPMMIGVLAASPPSRRTHWQPLRPGRVLKTQSRYAWLDSIWCRPVRCAWPANLLVSTEDWTLCLHAQWKGGASPSMSSRRWGGERRSQGAR